MASNASPKKRKEVDADGPTTKKQKGASQKFQYSGKAAVPMITGQPLVDDVGAYPYGLSWGYHADPSVLSLECKNMPGSSKIIGFDMDSTLIVPKSGKKFPQNAGDWKWWNPAVVPTLKKYWNNGYKIVIFTNQAGIEKNKTKPDEIKTKILALCKELGFPIWAYAAAATNNWRKPHSEMWQYLITKANSGVTVDLHNCVYVGDAAGRKAGWKAGAKRDFGCGDRKFGWNSGIPFQTPEEFFLGQKAVDFEWRSLDPVKFLEKAETEAKEETFAKDGQELMIFCGFPASGKSTFAENYFIPNGYEWINRDTLKTPAKCLKVAKEALKAGKSVVIDNTSPKIADRKPYIDAAKAAGANVRCIYFDIPQALAGHLNFYREHHSNGERRRVPDVAFNMYKKHAVPPTATEGISEILKVGFIPNFKSPSDREAFLEWTE